MITTNAKFSMRGDETRRNQTLKKKSRAVACVTSGATVNDLVKLGKPSLLPIIEVEYQILVGYQ